MLYAAKDDSSKAGFRVLIRKTLMKRRVLFRQMERHMQVLTLRMRNRAIKLNKKANNSYVLVKRVKTNARKSIQKRLYIHSCNVAKNIIKFSTRYVRSHPKKVQDVRKARKLSATRKNITKILKGVTKKTNKKIQHTAKTFKTSADKIAMLTRKARSNFRRSVDKQIRRRVSYVRRVAKHARAHFRQANRSIRKYVAHLIWKQKHILTNLIKRVKKEKVVTAYFKKLSNDKKLKAAFKKISVMYNGKKVNVVAKPFVIRDAKNRMTRNRRLLRASKHMYEANSKELENAREMMQNVVQKRHWTWAVRTYMNYNYLKNRSTLKGKVMAFNAKTIQNIVDIIKYQSLYLEKVALKRSTLFSKIKMTKDKKMKKRLADKAADLKKAREASRFMISIAKAAKLVIRRVTVHGKNLSIRMNGKNQFSKWSTVSKLAQLKLITLMRSIYHKTLAAKKSVLDKLRAVKYFVNSKSNLLMIRKKGLSRIRIVSRRHRHYRRVMRRATKAGHRASIRAATAVKNIAKKMNVKVNLSGKDCKCEPKHPGQHKKSEKAHVKQSKKSVPKKN